MQIKRNRLMLSDFYEDKNFCTDFIANTFIQLRKDCPHMTVNSKRCSKRSIYINPIQSRIKIVLFHEN